MKQPRAEMFSVRIHIGRWMLAEPATRVDDLGEESIKKAVKAHVEKYGGVERCLMYATQALVWDDGAINNLVAVYDIRGDKLTML